MKRHRCVAAALVAFAACGTRYEQPLPAEYAVWSAALDEELGGAMETLAVVSLPEDGDAWLRTDMEPAAVLQQAGVPRAAAHAYVASNPVMAAISARGFSSRRVRVVSWPPGWSHDALIAAGVVDGELRLSRVGFDERGDHALVAVFASCGAMCGRGMLLWMERGAGGRWHTRAKL